MKLTKRVNLILLPVILFVFLAAGLLSYFALNKYLKQTLVDAIGSELRFLSEDVDRSVKSVKSSMIKILNRPETIQFLNVKDKKFQAYSLESRLQELIEKSKGDNSRIESIQFFDRENNILVSTFNQGPFALDELIPIPNDMMYRAIIENEGEYLRFWNASDDIKIIYSLAFSPRLLLDDKFSDSDDLYTVLSLSKTSSFSSFKQRVFDNIAEDADIDFQFSNFEVDDEGIDVFINDTGIVAGLYGGGYSVSVNISNQAIENKIDDVKYIIIALVLFLTVLTVAVIRLMLKKHIISPIDKLIETIKSSRKDDQVLLEYMVGDDEFSQLNNAYIELLDDVQHLATYDTLTGLENRRSFQLWMERQLQRCHVDNDRMALLYIDLDNFKRVNDHYGHEVGDKLLKKFSGLLKDSVRPTDFTASMSGEGVARLAGDEFAVLLTNISCQESAVIVAERILNLFQGGFAVDGVFHNVQASIGIAMIPEDGMHAQTILRHADAAMYQAKSSGKNSYQFFTKSIAKSLKRKQKIEMLLGESISENSFYLVFMPICNPDDYSIKGVEFLIRCPILESENVTPDEFIPIAESTGLIKEIDLWVIEEAFRCINEFKDSKNFTGFFSINISAVELHNKQFVDQVQALMDKYRIDPSCIEFELTETSVGEDDPESLQILNGLKGLGFSLALDDFGTGYTAFKQLSAYPVDCLKIDRSFVNALGEDEETKKPMTDMIISLAELYDLKIIAEGVETKDQLEYLKGKHCPLVQGYFLHQPLSKADFIELI